MGISKRRLERIASRRTGVSLRRIDERGPHWVEDHFRIWLRQVLPDHDK